MISNIFVHIYKSTKNAMQSSNAKSKWCIRFITDHTKYNYPLMSWTGTKNTKQQLKLQFPSEEAAVNFAKKNYWSYKVIVPHDKKITLKSYSSNFK